MNARKQRDYYAGALMTALGLGAGYMAKNYDLGTLTNMGTGYFPLVLSVILAALGIAIMLTAGKGEQHEPESHGLSYSNRTGPDWRGWVAICAAVLLFIVLAEYAGLAPATFACVFVAAIGDRENTITGSALLALGVTVFSVALFVYGLRVQIPVFGRL